MNRPSGDAPSVFDPMGLLRVSRDYGGANPWVQMGEAMTQQIAPAPALRNFVQEYWVDAWQRGVLFLDILRQRGNAYRERLAEQAPNVLSFGANLVRDGRTLPRPCNYALVSIAPPEGVVIDPNKTPYIIVDPRAGHGPGIGGMKADSEIGEALAAGHPCYFIGFLPSPVPGQTIEDVCVAEAVFVEEVISRHPQAEGKPIIIANCQAGWQIMMMAAVKANLTGPIILAGSPLSYWAGARGKNPMRYTGGNLGGSWMTALAGDLGAGLFDGAYLVANFESLDLANTYWDKPYNVYAKADTEGPRFLDFEEWWGSPVLLNAGEMQWIVDNLFIGDRLSTGGLRTSDGVRIDLRSIRAPIIVFCSWGDNITPPQQALDWLLDLYENEQEIAENGQTIVYTLHDTVGHLGIFVSGKVATKEHNKFVNCMDMIELTPPGLYEAVIREAKPDEEALVNGKYVFSLQRRTLDDIRALGGNTPDENLCFAAAARVSETNCGLYENFARPAVRAVATEASADIMRRLHPNRVRFSMFSDENPTMRWVERSAAQARAHRMPAAPDNPLLAAQAAFSSWMSSWLKMCGTMRDNVAEAMFFQTYGSPLLQTAVGLGRGAPGRRAEKDVLREAIRARRRAWLETQIDQGGVVEAVLRAVIYVQQAEGGLDEGAFAMLQAMRASLAPGRALPVHELKEKLNEQSLLMRTHSEQALEAIPDLLPREADQRRAALEAMRAMISVRGALSDEGKERLEEVEALFDAKPDAASKIGAAHAGRQQPSAQQRPHS